MQSRFINIRSEQRLSGQVRFNRSFIEAETVESFNQGEGKSASQHSVHGSLCNHRLEYLFYLSLKMFLISMSVKSRLCISRRRSPVPIILTFFWVKWTTNYVYIIILGEMMAPECTVGKSNKPVDTNWWFGQHSAWDILDSIIYVEGTLLCASCLSTSLLNKSYNIDSSIFQLNNLSWHTAQIL